MAGYAPVNNRCGKKKSMWKINSLALRISKVSPNNIL